MFTFVQLRARVCCACPGRFEPYRGIRAQTKVSAFTLEQVTKCPVLAPVWLNLDVEPLGAGVGMPTSQVQVLDECVCKCDGYGFLSLKIPPCFPTPDA